MNAECQLSNLAIEISLYAHFANVKHFMRISTGIELPEIADHLNLGNDVWLFFPALMR